MKYCQQHEPRIGTDPIFSMAACRSPYCRIRTWLAVVAIHGQLPRTQIAYKAIHERSDDILSPLPARLTYKTLTW